MLATINSLLQRTTLDYLSTLDIHNPPTPAEIESELLEQITQQIQIENSARQNGTKWRIPQRLEPAQIADIVAALHPVCRINTSGEGADPSYDLLAVYQTYGKDEGIYVTDDETFRRLIEQYNYTIDSKGFKECMARLRTLVPRRVRNHEPHLIAVNNGIFNYDTKTLSPFTPDLIFLSKCRVNYNPNVSNPIIHNNEDNTDWDVESWMHDLSDDDEVVNVLWEILGAIIRPNVPWNKAAWFYSNTGNNGKGTLCELMRQLCGTGSFTSLPLADMGVDFMLEPLTRATAIITDENDVGTFIDKAANLKAIVTNDVVQINRKFKTPIPYRFYGFMVQCLNEMPRVRDKSDSFFRRQLFIPFTKCFTGKERKYIKHDYLHRQDVLEYVLHRILHMDYYQLSTPAACALALEEYKEYNDPVRQFLDEVLPEASWDVLPFTFLYAVYRGWFTKNMPSGKPLNKSPFIDDVLNVIKNRTDWTCPGRQSKIWVGDKMSCCELLIYQYDVKEPWKRLHTTKNGPYTIQEQCTPVKNQLPATVYGLQRIPNNTTIQEDTNDSKTEHLV